ncbi:MAG: LysE family translocator [Gammaproteobacteria bacterium]|nr:MAG: LysE family translocator [Gammaproteobacteria bacterium]
MNLENWLLFSSIAIIATITPGPAILLASTHSVSYGLKKALATILGNISGLFAMSALSVLGLSTVILYSTTVFVTVKFVGAAYLIYFGIKLWHHGFSGSKNQSHNTEISRKPPPAINLYMQGLFVAFSNPKAIAFTTALFPQFIDPAQPLISQFSILVATFMSLSFVCLFAYSYAAENMKRRPSVSIASAYLSKVFGLAFVASGVALAGASQK